MKYPINEEGWDDPPDWKVMTPEEKADADAEMPEHFIDQKP